MEEGTAETAFEVPPEHILQSSKGRDWQGIDIADVIHPHDDFALPAIARHVLVVNLGTAAEAREHLAGRQGHLGTGSLTILPAGAASKWHLDHEGEVRHLHLYVPPALIARIAAGAAINPDTVDLLDTIGVADPQIENIAFSLLAELRTGGLGGKLYVESLANLLVIHLLRQHSSAKQPSQPRARSLDGTTLRRVKSYIEEHLASDISLSDLAGVASLSPYHFARLFKAATGFSPHQYLIQRRVERARLLLVTTNWSLITIAHAVGFASESHLALHFKRFTGLTPGRYRQ